jgi:hypothetical protein
MGRRARLLKAHDERDWGILVAPLRLPRRFSIVQSRSRIPPPSITGSASGRNLAVRFPQTPLEVDRSVAKNDIPANAGVGPSIALAIVSLSRGNGSA